MKPGRGIFCPFRVNPRIFSGPPTPVSPSLPYPSALLPSLFALPVLSSSSILDLAAYVHLLRCFHLLPSSRVFSVLHFPSPFLILFSRINSIRHFFMCVSLFLLRCEISAVMNNSIMIMSLHNSLHRESYTLFLFYTAM